MTIETHEWYLHLDSGQQGPFRASDLRERLASGEIKSETLVWKEGFETWVRLDELPIFSAARGPAPTPPASRGKSSSWYDESDHDSAWETSREIREGVSIAPSGGAHFSWGALAAAGVVVIALSVIGYRIWGPSRRVVPLTGVSSGTAARIDTGAVANGNGRDSGKIELGVVPPILPGKKLEVRVLDVGQGDGILLLLPSGEYVLFDAGTLDLAGVIPYLHSLGIEKLKALVLSHPHADHIGGAFAVLKNFEIGAVYDCGATHPIKSYTRMLEEIEAQGIDYFQPRAGDVLNWDPNIRVTVLHPDRADYANVNNSSIVLHITYGDVSVLLTGDAEQEAEARILASFGDRIGARILKVGHHGSRTSSSAAFLKAVSPKIAVISCGVGNPHGHPHVETLQSLADAKVSVIRTDKDGFAFLETDGKSVAGRTARNPFPVAKTPLSRKKSFEGEGWREQVMFDSNVVQRKKDELMLIVSAGMAMVGCTLPTRRGWEAAVSLAPFRGDGRAGIVVSDATGTAHYFYRSGDNRLGFSTGGGKSERVFRGNVIGSFDRLGVRSDGSHLEFLARGEGSDTWYILWQLSNEAESEQTLDFYAEQGRGTVSDKVEAKFRELTFAGR